MKMNADKMEKKRQNAETDSEGSLKDFVVNDSDSSEGSSEEGKTGSDVQCVDSDNEVSAKKRRGTRANPIGEIIICIFFNSTFKRKRQLNSFSCNNLLHSSCLNFSF